MSIEQLAPSYTELVHAEEEAYVVWQLSMAVYGPKHPETVAAGHAYRELTRELDEMEMAL